MTTASPTGSDAGIQIIRDVAYLGDGPGADRAEKLDLYLPPGDGKGGGLESLPHGRPAVVVIHGGGWYMGDKTSDREVQMATTLAAAGFVCASINYLLYTPDRPCWPVCYHDCRAAVRFMREHAGAYGIDPRRIGAIGGSAGGCMSLLMAGPDHDGAAMSGRVQAVVALYPPTDNLSRNDHVRMFGHTKAEREQPYRDASPLHNLSDDFPPVLLLHGTADTIVPLDHSQRLAEALRTRGLRHELIVVEGAPHTFKLHEDRHDFRDKVVRFFTEVLR